MRAAIIDVDAGNSRLKWRLRGTSAVNVPDDLSMLASDWQSLELEVASVFVSSVASEGVNELIVVASVEAFGRRPHFAAVRNGVNGLAVAYPEPANLGVDRWLSMLAARAVDASCAWLVFGAGTALTADVISIDGCHRGGYIVPGVQVSLDSLASRTERISVSSLQPEKNWHPGSSTLECVHNGISALYKSYVEAIYQQALLSEPNLRTAWSGGALPFLKQLGFHCGALYYESSLVLDGLAEYSDSLDVGDT